MTIAARLAVAAALLFLAGCGLRPIYTGGSLGVAASALQRISIAPIAERSGQLVGTALVARLGTGGSGALYRLEVELDDKIEGFGVRGDDSITRERRTLRARYRLVSISGDRVWLDATVRSDAGIDVVRSSDFAVVAAETSALERLAGEIATQITARIALLAKTSPEFAAGQ